MTRALLILDTPAAKERAKFWVEKAPAGTRVEFKTSKRSLPQNARLHAMMTEVASQVTWHGLKLSVDDWKLIFLDALNREMRMVPNIYGSGFINLGRSTSKLTKEECSDLLELVFKFGAEHGVVFQDDRKAA